MKIQEWEQKIRRKNRLKNTQTERDIQEGEAETRVKHIKRVTETRSEIEIRVRQGKEGDRDRRVDRDKSETETRVRQRQE